MTLFQEVIRLKSTGPELMDVRDKALRGDPAALKVYVYYGVLQTIRRDKDIPENKKLPTFRSLCKADLVQVCYG